MRGLGSNSYTSIGRICIRWAAGGDMGVWNFTYGCASLAGYKNVGKISNKIDQIIFSFLDDDRKKNIIQKKKKTTKKKNGENK